VDLDQHGIVNLLKVQPRDLAVKFRSAAEAFRLIDDADSATVVVRYAAHQAQIESLLGSLATEGPQRWLMRKLQRYTVTIPERLAMQMLQRGDLSLPMPGLYVLANTDNLYSNILGLLGDADLYNPSAFAV
jgi:CRISPR-associated endonuclease/helicase Cas3